MTKQEFLNELGESLLEQVSQSEYRESMRYYDGYIEEGVRNGQTQEQVIASLGSPRLIAKSIIDASQGITDPSAYYETEPDEGYHENTSDMEKGFHAEYDGEKIHMRYGKLRFDTWYGKLVVCLVAIAVIVVVLGLLGVMASIVIRFVLPILFVIWIVGALVRMFRR